MRSRVFAERLGLEADWNCHISLADPPSDAIQGKDSHCTRAAQLASASSFVSSVVATTGPAPDVGQAKRSVTSAYGEYFLLHLLLVEAK